MGFPDAQYYTALCYINAIGTNSDYNAAKQYVNKCMYNEKMMCLEIKIVLKMKQVNYTITYKLNLLK